MRAIRVPEDTGALRRNTGYQIRPNSGIVNGRMYLGSKKKYAPYVHEGTRPHVIMPRKRGGTLAFSYRGRMVYAKRVNHPGTKAQPYLKNALTSVLPANRMRRAY